MTSSTARELQRRTSRPRKEKLTFAGDLRAGLLDALAASERLRFPSPKYQTDPVGFCRDILGIEPWSRQVEMLEAVRDHNRVAVRSGHRVSKSCSVACLALWFYCSFPAARVIMTSTTARQVDGILWREIRALRLASGRCVNCKRDNPDGPTPCPHSAVIEGQQGELARTGLKAPDLREIIGFAAREAEAIQGISGRNLLFICDEASGIPQAIFEGLSGNLAGGGRIVLTGNPTRNSGEFFDAFYSKQDLYHTLTISSEESPNVTEGRDVIPGLANRAWIIEKKQEWGEQSGQYKVRVLGQHALNEDGKIFSLDAITEAEQRWEETAAVGRLFIGLDPAGESGSGDETVFAVRRGKRLVALQAHRALNEEGHLVHLLALLGMHRQKDEPTPVVVVDREGSVGSRVNTLLVNYAAANKGTFELVSVRASDKSPREPHVYDRHRDALAANLELWFRDGGAIPEDAKLTGELHVFEWKMGINGRLKLTPKEQIRKELGRSPDRFDALSLSVWEPLWIQEGKLPPSARASAEPAPQLLMHDPYAGNAGHDPYASWGGRGRR